MACLRSAFAASILVVVVTTAAQPCSLIWSPQLERQRRPEALVQRSARIVLARATAKPLDDAVEFRILETPKGAADQIKRK